MSVNDFPAWVLRLHRIAGSRYYADAATEVYEIAKGLYIEDEVSPEQAITQALDFFEEFWRAQTYAAEVVAKTLRDEKEDDGQLN
jgi:hypothetical protein